MELKRIKAGHYEYCIESDLYIEKYIITKLRTWWSLEINRITKIDIYDKNGKLVCAKDKCSAGGHISSFNSLKECKDYLISVLENK